MRNFDDLIRRHEAEMQALHQILDEAVKVRDQSASRQEAWRRAALNFNNYRSEVDDYLSKIKNVDIEGWSEGRKFVFCYFAVDPIYFRSGHTKEWLIRKVKALDFDESEKAVIRDLIVGRVHKGAMREFKHFCRLIPRIQNKNFSDSLHHLSNTKARAVSRRAKFALCYLKSV